VLQEIERTTVERHVDRVLHYFLTRHEMDMSIFEMLHAQVCAANAIAYKSCSFCLVLVV
jgi:hypothetical protein